MKQMECFVVRYKSNTKADEEVNNLNTVIFKPEKARIQSAINDRDLNTYNFVQNTCNRMFRLIEARIIGTKKELLNDLDEAEAVKVKKTIGGSVGIMHNCYTVIDNTVFRIYIIEDLELFNEIAETQYMVIDGTHCSDKNIAFEEAMDQVRSYALRQFDGDFVFKSYKRLQDYKLADINDRVACSKMALFASKLFDKNGFLKSSFMFGKEDGLAKRNELLKAFDDNYQFLKEYQEISDSSLSLTNKE